MALSTGGEYNTAAGAGTLVENNGSENTAYGAGRGSNNAGGITGSFNTFLRYSSGTFADPLTNASAIGAYALVGVNNAMILGGTGNYAVTVGIGTGTPYNDYALDVDIHERAFHNIDAPPQELLIGELNTPKGEGRNYHTGWPYNLRPGSS